MDYFNDVLTTFLDHERVSYVDVYAGSESSWISPETSFVPKMNKVFTGLKQQNE